MTALIIILLLAPVAWAIYHTMKKSRKGGGCCGEHETVKRTTVTDRNKAHYPYEVELDIAGMTCENCAVKIENALNGLDGVWAQVDLGSKTAKVLMKTAPDEKSIRNAVSGEGYVAMGCRSYSKYSMEERMNKSTVIRQWLQILLGLTIFAYGNHLIIYADIGVSPWDTLSLGIANKTPLSYGDAVAASSAVVMIIALAMKERIGFATLGGAFLTGYIVQFFNRVSPMTKNENLWTGILWLMVGLTLVCIGTWLYMSAGQYAGPRDALMVGIGKRLRNIPIGAVQIGIWAVVCFCGWLLGGPVGIGTLITTFGNGLILQAVFRIVHFEPRNIRNRDVVEVLKILMGRR